jgi:O-antigen ligase
VYFHVAHLHNGFLQVMLELGSVGLALCLVFLGQVASRCVSLLMEFPSFRSTFPAALLLLVLLHNTTEVSLLYGHSLQWCLLVFVAVQTTIDLSSRRLTAASRRPRLKPRGYRNDAFETGSRTSGASRMTLQ